MTNVDRTNLEEYNREIRESRGKQPGEERKKVDEILKDAAESLPKQEVKPGKGPMSERTKTLLEERGKMLERRI